MSSSQYPLPAPRISPNPYLHVISVNSSSRLGGKCIPDPAVGPKAAAAVPSVSASRRPGVAPPHTQYPLQVPRTKPNPFPYACSCNSDQGIGGRASPKSALESKTAAVVTLICPSRRGQR